MVVTLENHDKGCPFCQGLHWYKYVRLEEKMLEIFKVITLDKGNFMTWGEEISDLLVLTGNAVEVFFKDMYDCPNMSGLFSKKKKKINMDNYREIYEPYYELSENRVFASYGLGKDHLLFPFKDFEIDSPVWWKAYNKIKHSFYSNMEEANLLNLLNALSGLFILNTLHLCSSFFLVYDGKIKTGWKTEYPLHVANGLLTSKIGTSKWAEQSMIQTKFFRFLYRLDETIKSGDKPLLKIEEIALSHRPAILSTTPE